MKQLARAAQLAAQAEGESAEDNPIAENSRLIAAKLTAQGWSAPAAQKAAQTRIFSGASGSYGSGLGDAALATDTWQGKADGDRKLAQLYLSKMQFAYGPDESDWGKSGAELQQAAGGRGAEGINLYAAQLKGTQGAVLSRSSNLYGMLTTDDPFQYLGGIASAVRHLDGKAPELYISNLRGSGAGKVEGAAAFLAKELATRNFHPGHIKGLMAEGYAGTLQILDSVNNFAGWTAVAREIVRDDQWQEFAEVYVQDKHRLGLNQWFERENPHALAQTIERMLEAARQGYWQADAATLDTLKARYRDLARRFDVRTDNAELQRYAGLPGYGLSQPVAPAVQASRPASANSTVPPPAQEQPQPPAPAPQAPQIQGVKLEPVTATPAQAFQNQVILALVILLLLPIVGAWRQWRITARRTA
jgi:cobaltochelatase CobN